MSRLNNVLQGKKVLVTGATGFIGGRLAERLATEEGAIVTGMGRDVDKVPFLRQAGVNLVAADLQDTAVMRELMTGQAIVFHVAAWMRRHKGDNGLAHALNVTATENLVQIAAEAGIERFVLVSSVAAYGFPHRLLVDETHPLNVEQIDLYGRTKALGELRAFTGADNVGLDLVAVRPGMVYGPRSPGWTISMLKLVQKGTPVIFGNGSGYACPIYIDNLIDGILLTAVHPNAVGEAFNLSEPPITLRDYFGYFGRMCGRKPRRIPLWAAYIMLGLNKLLRLGLPLNRERIKMYSLKADYSSAKVQELLGYRQRLSTDEGMRRTEKWLREAGYL